tara:strand:+ start:242 stop:439 length:198 start_codon:yes stop_codon:yes gene_type:complete
MDKPIIYRDAGYSEGYAWVCRTKGCFGIARDHLGAYAAWQKNLKIKKVMDMIASPQSKRYRMLHV